MAQPGWWWSAARERRLNAGPNGSAWSTAGAAAWLSGSRIYAKMVPYRLFFVRHIVNIKGAVIVHRVIVATVVSRILARSLHFTFPY